MKYLIFGSNKKNFITNEKFNLNTHIYDIEESWNMFCNIAAKKRFKYLYLIVDFEIHNSKWFDILKEDTKGERCKFLTIAFCDSNLKYNINNMIVKDDILLRLEEENNNTFINFINNLTAINDFQYYIENKIKAIIHIRLNRSNKLLCSKSIIDHNNKCIKLYYLKDPGKRIKTR